MPADPILDHLEKSFANSYRKEIDQEENVWRSLPFFAATLALQLTAVAQMRDWVLSATGPVALAAAAILGLAAAATLLALVFLAASIWPAEFRYVTAEPELMEYAERVRAEALAHAGATPDQAAAAALAAVRASMTRQYAGAVASNRAINRRRAGRRTQAGVAILVSVLLVLGLLALSVVTTSPGSPGGTASHGVQPVRPARHQPGPAAGDGGGPQGLVPHPRPAGAGGGDPPPGG